MTGIITGNIASIHEQLKSILEKTVKPEQFITVGDNIDEKQLTISISAAILSGFGATLISSFSEKKKEYVRQQERYQDQLKIDLRDLKIQLYQVEKDLDEWKDKYYEAIKQLIEVRAELEETLIRLSIIHIEHEHENE